MKHYLYIFLFMLFFLFDVSFATAKSFTAKVNIDEYKYQNQVIDSNTNQPLSNAKITIPELHYTTFSDKNGNFQLNANINQKTVLFVEKDGYKVFSLTVDKSVVRNSLKLGIEKSSPFDLQISQGIIHLGDDMFSDNSANSRDFRQHAKGHYMVQEFKKPIFSNNQDVVIRIGTIIGLDTKKAKQTGQNRISRVYSSPVEVYINGQHIINLELNGDNKEILIPKNLLKENNELLIKTGRNLFQTEYTDYDDIELANIRVEIREKHHYAGN